MKRATMSFDKKREKVSHVAAQESTEQVVTRRVSFSNNDVPSFILELRRFQKDSLAKRILAR